MRKATPLERWLASRNGLPPNDSDCTALVPSSNSELTRTRADGRRRYGAASVSERLKPNEVSLSSPNRYPLWRVWSPPRQLVRSPPYDGSSVAKPDAGFWRFQLPVSVTLKACPALDDGGAMSMLPMSEPWSLTLSLGVAPTRAGTAEGARMPSSRDTESDDTPTARSPSGSVSSRLWRSLSRRPS